MQIAETEYCLSLCGIVPSWTGAREAASFIAELAAFLPAAGQGFPQRVYIGSSFCPRLLLAWNERAVGHLAEWCSESGCKLTLVLPISTQKALALSTRHAESLVSGFAGVIDEVTLNDYGALAHWGTAVAEGLPLTLNMGRILYKDTRDPRDAFYTQSTHEPRVLERDWNGWGGIERFCQTWPIGGIELDPTHLSLDLSGLPAGIQPAVHGPLCYMSTGQICEFAGIGAAVEHKFRPNSPCSLQCQASAVRYNGASGEEFLKIGRSIYFRQEQVEVLGDDSCRYVYSPLEEVLA